MILSGTSIIRDRQRKQYTQFHFITKAVLFTRNARRLPNIRHHPASMSYLAKFRASKANQLLQKLARVLQFISAIISLGLFSQRLKAILTRSHDYSRSDGAVEGILAAASLYSLLATLMQFALRHGAPKLLRWFLILMDVLFIGAFIAVAVLTRPNGGPSGDHKGQCARQRGINGLVPQNIRNQFHCRLPLGTFVLAIIST